MPLRQKRIDDHRHGNHKRNESENELGCVYELLSFDSEVILFPGEARRRRIASCSVTEEQRSQGTKGLDSRRNEFVNTA